METRCRIGTKEPDRSQQYRGSHKLKLGCQSLWVGEGGNQEGPRRSGIETSGNNRFCASEKGRGKGERFQIPLCRRRFQGMGASPARFLHLHFSFFSPTPSNPISPIRAWGAIGLPTAGRKQVGRHKRWACASRAYTFRAPRVPSGVSGSWGPAWIAPPPSTPAHPAWLASVLPLAAPVVNPHRSPRQRLAGALISVDTLCRRCRVRRNR